MHGPSPGVVEPAEVERLTSDNNSLNYSTTTANNNLDTSHNSVIEHNQSLSSEVDTSNSFDSSSRPQSPFHPTRQSTPILERRQVLQLPPLQRSNSASETPADTTVDPPQRQHRHSISGVPLNFRSEPNEVPDSVESSGPFPVRPGRLPPLQRLQLDQQQGLSSSFQGQTGHKKRRKKRRQRTHSWHGEVTEIIPTIQQVNLSPVAE